MSEKDKITQSIYSAPWVLPIAQPAIKNGGVAVKNGVIEAVGPVEELRAAYPDGEETTYGGLLMPGLINAHIHLELSHLKGVERPDSHGQMCRWIEALLQARVECEVSSDQQVRLRNKAIADQFRSGVVLMADIGNDPYLGEPERAHYPLINHFQEFLAPTKTAADAAVRAVNELPDGVSVSAHACYSTLPDLIRILKDRAKRLRRIFPIHVAESAEEIEFIQTLSGPFRDFLKQRGAWDSSFKGARHTNQGVVNYLHDLGVLDNMTLCIHCVHINEKETGLLAQSGSHLCLCPGSNRFLRVGKAPLEIMLQGGLLPAIGTDSIASNDRLDMWSEMRLLREEHPTVDPLTILKMATLGGAAALHCQDVFGSLSSGHSALILHVDSEPILRAVSESDIYDILTREGRPTTVDWIAADGGQNK